MTTLVLMTGCWTHYRPQHGLAVRISLGRPKWFPNEGRDLPFVKALTPNPAWWQTDDDDEFRRRYRHQLHRWTVDRVLGELRGIAVQYDCPRLVLCCWEANPLQCHRTMFSAWWLEQTGEEIPDLSDVTKADR